MKSLRSAYHKPGKASQPTGMQSRNSCSVKLSVEAVNHNGDVACQSLRYYYSFN